MKNRKIIWSVFFIIGLVMILNSENWTRWIGRERDWVIAGVILSVVTGCGLLLELYKKRK